MPVFEAFVDAPVDRYQRSTHLILRSLMEGFVATALVLVERGSGSVPSLGAEPGPDWADASVTTRGLGARAPAGRLAELRTVHSRAMPTDRRMMTGGRPHAADAGRNAFSRRRTRWRSAEGGQIIVLWPAPTICALP